MPKTYTVKEVADILGFSTNSIYTFLKEKRIKGVRVGKGRFRIPEEELARILHISKKSAVTTPAPVAAPEAVSARVLKPEGDAAFITPQSSYESGKADDVLVPNIFDWFVGLASLIAGVGLFLFNSSTNSLEIARTALVFPVIRVVLIACGFGVILSSIFAQGRNWHRVFLYALSVLGFVNAFGLARNGDMEGTFLYGGLALIIGVTNAVPFGGIVTIGLYATLMVLLYPVTMVFFPSDTHVQLLSGALHLSAPLMVMGSSIIGIVLLVLFWVGYASNRRLFIAATCLLGLADMVVAVWYAHLQFWSRSFFIIVLGYFTVLLPYWWPLQQKIAKRYKLVLHGLFLVIGSVLIIAVLVVYLLQQNLWNARESEFTNKIKVAQLSLNSAVESVQGSLSVAAQNREFIDTFVKKDLEKLTVFAKIVYESNPNIRRLVFLDKDGNGVALYPYGTFDQPNLSFRDYFIQAKSTGRPYVSNVFQSQADHAGRYVVVVAVPLQDAKGDFAGVIAGSIDLNRVGLQLAQIAADTRGEYFVVTDSKGVILIHPDEKLIGTDVSPGDPMLRGLSGVPGVTHGITLDAFYGMVAYADVPILRWVISLRVPAENVFELSYVSIWCVYGTVVVLLLVGIGIFSYARLRMGQSKEGGT